MCESQLAWNGYVATPVQVKVHEKESVDKVIRARSKTLVEQPLELAIGPKHKVKPVLRRPPRRDNLTER